MYKDKEKQREATKDRVRRYRDKQKGVTTGMVEGVFYPDNGKALQELRFSKSAQAKGRLPNALNNGG